MVAVTPQQTYTAKHISNTAKPINNTGGASKKIYLRKGKKMLHSSFERGVKKKKKVRETTLQIPRSEKQEGEGSGALSTSTEVLLQPVERTVVKHVVALQSMEDTTPQQVAVSSRKLPPVESPHGSRNCGLCGTHAGAVCS